MALTEGIHTAEFLLSEANGSLSRTTGTVTVAATTTLAPGTVLEIAAGKYVVLATSTNAAAVLYSELANATGAPVDMTGVVVDRFAEIRLADLTWPSGWVAANWAASLTALLALGIKAR